MRIDYSGTPMENRVKATRSKWRSHFCWIARKSMISDKLIWLQFCWRYQVTSWTFVGNSINGPFKYVTEKEFIVMLLKGEGRDEETTWKGY